MRDNDTKIFQAMAFPLVVIDNSQPGKEIQHICTGMTLRDYMAAKAMAAVWSKLDPDSVRDISITQTAKAAYQLADAMLKARES